MKTISKDEFRQIVERTGQPARVVAKSLENRGHTLEGLDEFRNSAAKAPVRSTFTQKLLSATESLKDYATAPVEAASQGLAFGAAKVLGNERVQQNLRPELLENVEQAGKTARVGLPIIAGIATGGAGLLPAAAAVGAAGATGQLAKEGSEAILGEQKTLKDFTIDPLVAGAFDATLDVATAGLFKGLGAAGRALGSKTGLKEGARKSIAKALRPTTDANKAKTAKIADKLIDQPLSKTFAVTRKGLEENVKAEKQIAGEAIDTLGPLKGKTPVSQIVDFLEQEKQQFVAGGKIVDEDGVSQIDAVQNVFRQYGENIDDEVLRTVRRIFDRTVDEGKGFQKTLKEGSGLNIKKTAANRIRGILADAHPEVAKVNKEYNFWSDLDEVISATNQRTTGQTGFKGFLAGLAGAGSGRGSVNSALRFAVFRGLANAFDSPAWNLVSAKVKSKLATSLAEGNFAKVLSVLDEEMTQRIGKAGIQTVTAPLKTE